MLDVAGLRICKESAIGSADFVRYYYLNACSANGRQMPLAVPLGDIRIRAFTVGGQIK